MTSSSRSLTLISGPVGLRVPGGAVRRRLPSRTRLGLALGLSLILLGLGYFTYHWAYGHWSYQGRHVRLRHEYLLFVEKHEFELQDLLRHAGPDHRCENCNPASGEIPPFVLTGDRDIAVERSRLAILRSEADWQGWLAGPWRRRKDQSVASWNAVFPGASENSPRTSSDSPGAMEGGGPIPSSFLKMRGIPMRSTSPTGSSGGPLPPPENSPRTSPDSPGAMQGGPIPPSIGEMRAAPMASASPPGRSGGPLPPPSNPARKNL